MYLIFALLIEDDTMIRPKALICFLILLATLFTVSCDTEEKKDKIVIRIFCYSSASVGFSRWYIKNGETPQFGTVNTASSGVYYEEITLEDVDEVEIEAVSLDLASSMAIKIYKDDVKVKEVTQDASSSPAIIRLNTTYTYGESSEAAK
jgi:hypothetical protein